MIMNLQGADRDLSRRLIDFASGLCYGLNGSMEKVATGVYLLIGIFNWHDLGWSGGWPVFVRNALDPRRDQLRGADGDGLVGIRGHNPALGDLLDR